MKLLSALAIVLACALSPLVVAAAGAVGGDLVNATCPITGKPVDGELCVEHGDVKIGVCCKRCKGAVSAWSAVQRDAYVSRTRGEKPAVAAAKETAQAFAEPDLLDLCPITGEALGDEPVEVELRAGDGPARTVRVCCGGCARKAQEDPAGTLAKVDELIAAQQRAWYPTRNCIVIAGEALEADGEDVAEEVVVGGRLFRVCCAGCVRQVRQDPVKFAAQLDELAREAQRADYPLDHCAVMKQRKLAEGEGRELIVGGLFVRVCCEKCEAAVRAYPRRHLAELIAVRAGDGDEAAGLK